MKQFFFANGNIVEISESEEQMERRIVMEFAKNVFQQLKLKIWQTFEVSYTVSFSFKEWVERNHWGTVHSGISAYVNLNVLVRVDGRPFETTIARDNGYGDPFRFADTIRFAITDHYDWKDYCYEKRKRQYFGPRKPKPINVIC